VSVLLGLVQRSFGQKLDKVIVHQPKS